MADKLTDEYLKGVVRCKHASRSVGYQTLLFAGRAVTPAKSCILVSRRPWKGSPKRVKAPYAKGVFRFCCIPEYGATRETASESRPATV